MASTNGAIEDWREWWPAILFGGAVLALVASFTVTASESPWAVVLLWIIGAIFLVQVAGIVLKDGDIFAPPTLFIFSTAIFYIIRPLGIISGSPSVIENHSSADMCRALGLVIVSTVAFYGGYWLPGTKSLGDRIPAGSPRWPRLRLYVLVGFIFLIACGAWVLFLSRVGGLAYWLMNLHYGVHYLRRGLGHLYTLASFTGLAFILLYAYGLRRGVSRIILYPFGIICLGILLTLGERGMFVIWMLMAIIIFHYLKHRIDWKRAIVYVLPVIILFTGVGMWREYTGRGELPAFQVQAHALQMNLTSFDMLLFLSHHTPDPIDYQWGQFIPAFFTVPIPRAIFPDKQPTLTMFVNEHAMGRDYPGTIAISLPGEGYINAGLAGVLLYSLAFGFLSRLAYEYLQSNRQNISVVLMYSLWVAVFVSMFRGGLTDFAASMATVRISFMALVICLLSLGQPRGDREKTELSSAS